MEEREQPHGAGADRAHLGLPVQARDAGGVAAQELRGEVAQRAHDERLDQLDLLEEVGGAVLDLGRLGIAIARRAAFQEVQDEHLPAVQPDLPEQLVQQLPRLADEGQALPVLVGSRGLAHEHQVGIRVAVPEHHGGAGVSQRTARALPGLEPDLLERLAPLRGSRHTSILATPSDDSRAA